jgi:DNA mismatch repair protein MutS
MQNDKTTLKDLSIFPADGSGGVFALIDRTVTQEGREALRKHIQQPPASCEALCELQEVIRYWHAKPDRWPAGISNGTLVMLEKFFEAADNTAPPATGIAGLVAQLLQKTFNKREYFFTKFSVSHLSDFLNGCSQLSDLLQDEGLPALLRRELESIKGELQYPLTEELTAVTERTAFTQLQMLQYRARREMKNITYRLIAIYARLDGWHSMALATLEHKWTFPELLPEKPVLLQADGFWHPLINSPVTYDVSFSEGQNFMLLTGANMSGKTTFLRALGVSSLLAHLGMGVPAASMKTSFMHGIITNMHTEDNILKGESYFFAEVQRMKLIAAQISEPGTRLALMDELFKGTNVHDAFECTRAVVTGLMNHPNHVMALSTHLYEVAQQFNADERIVFAHFVTNISADGQYTFTYRLKPGISNDRIGYLILQQEGVIDLLGSRKTR